jgi:hypothetical protein
VSSLPIQLQHPIFDWVTAIAQQSKINLDLETGSIFHSSESSIQLSVEVSAVQFNSHADAATRNIISHPKEARRKFLSLDF